MKMAENTDGVNQPVQGDPRLTVQIIVEDLGQNRESVRTILLQELGMRKECAKMVPKLLSDDQKEQQVNVC